MIFSNQTKHSSSFSNATKHYSSYSNQGVTPNEPMLLIDDTFKFLIDDTHFLDLQGISQGSGWNNQNKS